MRSAPDDWGRTTIGELCSFTSGTGFGPSDWAKSGLPIIRIQNLNGSQDFNYYAGAPDPSWIVEPGELPFAWAGVKGVSFGPTIWRGARGLLNQHIYRILPAAHIELDWLYLQLQHVTASIEASAHGFKSNLVHVRKSDITGQVCCLPPIEEQRAIAGVVTTWDRGIQQLTDLIAAKLRFKQGLMQQLLTGKRRFPQFKGEWKHEEIGHYLEECSSRVSATTTLPIYTSSRVGLKPQEDYYGGRKVINDGEYGVVPIDCFVFRHMSDDGLFVFHINQTAGDVAVSKEYPVFRAINLDRHFLLAKLNHSTDFKTFALSQKAGGTRTRLYFSKLRNWKTLLPSLPEQRRISEVLNAADREIDLLRREFYALKQQKKGLMLKLLTGQLRVPLPKGVA